MKCDVIAEGVIAAAARRCGFDVPLVVRLEGTNVEQGRADPRGARACRSSPPSDLDDAAKKVCAAVARREGARSAP